MLRNWLVRDEQELLAVTPCLLALRPEGLGERYPSSIVVEKAPSRLRFIPYFGVFAVSSSAKRAVEWYAVAPEASRAVCQNAEGQLM